MSLPILALLLRYFYLPFIGITPNLHVLEILEVGEKVIETDPLLPEFSVRRGLPARRPGGVAL